MIAAMNTPLFRPFAALVCALCLPLSAVAQQSPQSASAPPPAEEPGFTWALGYGRAGGDFGDLLQKPVTGDYNVFKIKGKWRWGMGLRSWSMQTNP